VPASRTEPAMPFSIDEQHKFLQNSLYLAAACKLHSNANYVASKSARTINAREAEAVLSRLPRVFASRATASS